MHTIGTNHTRIAGNCVKTCLASHSCFLVGARPISLDQKLSVRRGTETRGSPYLVEGEGGLVCIPPLLSAFHRGFPAPLYLFVAKRINFSYSSRSSLYTGQSVGHWAEFQTWSSFEACQLVTGLSNGQCILRHNIRKKRKTTCYRYKHVTNTTRKTYKLS